MWSELTWFIWSDFILKWSEVSYSEVLGDKSVMYVRVTLYWGYLIVLWLFHLVCILYCGCFNWFCNVWVCVCARACVRVCFGNMYNCIYCVLYCCTVFFVLFHLCIFTRICFVCTSVRTTAEWQLYYYYYYYYYCYYYCSCSRSKWSADRSDKGCFDS